MLSQWQRNISPRMLETIQWIISLTTVLSKIFEKIVAGQFSHFSEGNIPSLFSYRKGLGTCDSLLTLPHHLKFALDIGMERRFAQLDFTAAFDFLSHRCLLYKLRSIGVGGLFLFIVNLASRKCNILQILKTRELLITIIVKSIPFIA